MSVCESSQRPLQTQGQLQEVDCKSPSIFYLFNLTMESLPELSRTCLDIGVLAHFKSVLTEPFQLLVAGLY